MHYLGHNTSQVHKTFKCSQVHNIYKCSYALILDMIAISKNIQTTNNETSMIDEKVQTSKVPTKRLYRIKIKDGLVNDMIIPLDIFIMIHEVNNSTEIVPMVC
jgi:hypothetical protein